MAHKYKVGQVVRPINNNEAVGVIVQQIVLGMIINCENSYDPVDMVPYAPHNYEHMISEEEYNEPCYRIVWTHCYGDTFPHATPTVKYNDSLAEKYLVPLY
jgi:hypothetical protein